jgi:hypothetical protein
MARNAASLFLDRNTASCLAFIRGQKETPMDTSLFLPILTFGTMFAVIVFALVSKERTERRRKDPNAPKSSLAEDAPNEHRH